MEENIASNFSVVTVLTSGGLTKKHFGHYAILKFFPLDHQVSSQIQKLSHFVRWKHDSLVDKRTCEANPGGENSSFIFTNLFHFII